MAHARNTMKADLGSAWAGLQKRARGEDKSVKPDPVERDEGATDRTGVTL